MTSKCVSCSSGSVLISFYTWERQNHHWWLQHTNSNKIYIILKKKVQLKKMLLNCCCTFDIVIMNSRCLQVKQSLSPPPPPQHTLTHTPIHTASTIFYCISVSVRQMWWFSKSKHVLQCHVKNPVLENM